MIDGNTAAKVYSEKHLNTEIKNNYHCESFMIIFRHLKVSKLQLIHSLA